MISQLTFKVADLLSARLLVEEQFDKFPDRISQYTFPSNLQENNARLFYGSLGGSGNVVIGWCLSLCVPPSLPPSLLGPHVNRHLIDTTTATAGVAFLGRG